MILEPQIALSLSHRDNHRGQDRLIRLPAEGTHLPRSHPDERRPRADEVILDLALCLILAATIVGLLVQAL